jgi:excisionase family DNA binding protein
MTNFRNTRHEARVHPVHITTGGWRPAPDPTPHGARDGERSEPSRDPATLLGGDRLALTVTEASAVLGISRALAYELVARGELPSIRLGRRLVVPKVALLEMLGLHPRRES